MKEEQGASETKVGAGQPCARCARPGDTPAVSEHDRCRQRWRGAKLGGARYAAGKKARPALGVPYEDLAVYEASLTMTKTVPQIAMQANIDPGNMRGVPHAEPAVEGIGILGDRIAYVHVKNARRVPFLSLGIDYDWRLHEGDLDYYAIVAALVYQGFDGPYTVEWSGNGDPNVPAREDIRYLKGILADVAADNAAEGERALRQPALAGLPAPLAHVPNGHVVAADR